MKRRLNRVSACKALLCFMAFGLASPTVSAAPVISATKKDTISTDVNNNAMANPGDTLKYTVTIKNTGDMSGPNVQFTDTLDPNTTLVPGSVTATPIAANDNYTISGNTNLNSMFITAANGLLVNDSDPDGGPVSATPQSSQATTRGGTVDVFADGSFEYIPVAGNSMTDTFTYTITDDEGKTDTGTVSIMFPEVIWYVDSSRPPGGNGTSGSPFNNLASAQTASLANHMIYVLSGAAPAVTGQDAGITLKAGQSLVGQGVDLVVDFNGTDNKILYPAGTPPVITNTAGNGVTLASGNTIKGLNIGNASNPVIGTGIADNGASFGTLTVNSVTVTTSTGPTLDLDVAGTLATTFGSLSSSNSAGRGLRLANLGGTFTVSGPTTISSAVTNEGVLLTGNPTGTFNFAGGLNITNTGNTGFSANNSGTVNVTGTANTIATTTGIALNLTNTTIGASGVTFFGISASNAPNGIVLNNTGASGGAFAVTGNGTVSSGGTIQSTTNRGASFISARNISLTDMNFTNAGTSDLDADNSGLSTGDNLATNAAIHLETVFTATLNGIVINSTAEQGINGHNVKDFTLQSSSITNAGNAADEDGIHFYNMLGTSEITNTTISNSGDDNLNIQNNTNAALPAGMTAALNLAITNGSANTGVLGSGYLMGIRGTSTATVTIDGVTANNNFSGGVVIDTFDTATSTIEVKNSTSTNNNDGISLSSNNGSTKFDIHDNVSFAGNDFGRINILKAAFSTTGTLQGKIRNNPIAVSDGQAADGIIVNQAGDGTLTASITGNTIAYRGTQRAMLIQGGQDGSGQLNATVTGNTIDMQLDGTGNAVAGILAQTAVASPSGDNTNMCADIGGAGALNVFTHSLGNNMAAGDIRVRQRFVTTVTLPGYGGANNDNTAVVTYLTGRNTLVNSPTATATNDVGVVVGAGGFVGGGACTQPVFP